VATVGLSTVERALYDVPPLARLPAIDLTSRTFVVECGGERGKRRGSPMFLMRFGMRSETVDPTARADMYAAAIEMTAWAEDRGCVASVVSQHHASDDGYLPSPVPLAVAMAARTSTIPISVAALLLAFYEPIKLAEDLAVVDLISRGRVSYVVGIGYRDEEFDLFGVDRRQRARLIEERILLLRRLWSGETVEYQGRQVRITPTPFSPGGPLLAYGGGSQAAARRAGRLGMLFLAETPDSSLESTYLEAAAEAGATPLGCMFPTPDVPLTVFVADDPERAWAELGDYLMVDARGYAAWNAGREGTASVSFAPTVEALREEHGQYQILTPDEARAHIAGGEALGLQPLVGGIPPEVAWPYLEAAAAVCAP
jgi:alkanesulfonate monooxygenase SsuD/methylene tetrahydromethanopterin reductase-like flavin-dependent oxidoreductase (luciferase family)